MSATSERGAIVLLSGGMDSSTCLAIARERGFDCYALSFRYGQRHAIELEAAARVAASLGVRRHLTVDVDMRPFGGSALTDTIAVPKGRDPAQIGEGIPVTYVPARNTLFLSFALAWAEVLEVSDIFIGVNARDYSGYPDCRPEFIAAFEQLARTATRLGTEGGARIRVHTPLIEMDKAEIVRAGLARGLDFGLTHTCYDPTSDGRSCGGCDACLLRLKGFAEAGATDPLPYANAAGDVEAEHAP